jgi:hypothetical protein
MSNTMQVSASVKEWQDRWTTSPMPMRWLAPLSVAQHMGCAIINLGRCSPALLQMTSQRHVKASDVSTTVQMSMSLAGGPQDGHRLRAKLPRPPRSTLFVLMRLASRSRKSLASRRLR